MDNSLPVMTRASPTVALMLRPSTRATEPLPIVPAEWMPTSLNVFLFLTPLAHATLILSAELTSRLKLAQAIGEIRATVSGYLSRCWRGSRCVHFVLCLRAHGPFYLWWRIQIIINISSRQQ